MNRDNGITLVALVVTIIVILIIAGISINSVIGDNGLITKAKEARKNWEDMQISEKEERKKLENELMNNKTNENLEDDKIEIRNYSNTTVLTNSKINMDWKTIVEVANIIATDENITSDTSQVKLKVKGKYRSFTKEDEKGQRHLEVFVLASDIAFLEKFIIFV